MSQLARIKLSASWGRFRRALRPLGKPRAFVGWMLLLLDMAHRVEFVTSLFRGTAALAFLQQWGWLVGVLWLVTVVVWAANKPQDEEVQKARRMEQLRSTILDAIRKFEALSRAYERDLPQTARIAGGGRFILAHAVGNLIRDALKTIPEDQQKDYKIVLLKVLIDYEQYYDFDITPTRFAAEVHPTLPILIALDMQPKKAADSSELPSTDPPSPKASE